MRNGFYQHELNELVRDLGLSKKASELLSSRLNEKNLLEKGAKVTYFRSRDSAFLQYLEIDHGLVYCQKIRALMKKLGISDHKATEWRLFIDSSKSSWKCVLLYNRKLYGSVAIGHLVPLFMSSMKT